jgi:Putative DNA-binding domain
MPTLDNLQHQMAAAICGCEEPELLGSIESDGIDVEARLRIYRNHALVTLTEALKASFPAVCRLVDERFFAYAAHDFIRANPPTEARLTHYGAQFPSFLAAFPACRELVYLPDVARLEWAVNTALHADATFSLDRSALRSVSPAQAPNLVLALHPSWQMLESRWPIDRIWRANQSDGEIDGTIDLDAGGVRLEVYRLRDRIVVAAIEPAGYAFRAALARGNRLEAAVDAALGVDPLFDLALTLRLMFEAGLIVGCDLATPTVTNTQGKEE